jgi:hypothetical protein
MNQFAFKLSAGRLCDDKHCDYKGKRVALMRRERVRLMPQAANNNIVDFNATFHLTCIETNVLACMHVCVCVNQMLCAEKLETTPASKQATQ